MIDRGWADYREIEGFRSNLRSLQAGGLPGHFIRLWHAGTAELTSAPPEEAAAVLSYRLCRFRNGYFFKSMFQ